jgi:hypothetical protein
MDEPLSVTAHRIHWLMSCTTAGGSFVFVDTSPFILPENTGQHLQILQGPLQVSSLE